MKPFPVAIFPVMSCWFTALRLCACRPVPRNEMPIWLAGGLSAAPREAKKRLHPDGLHPRDEWPLADDGPQRTRRPSEPRTVLVWLFAIACGALVANLYYAQMLLDEIGPEIGLVPRLPGSSPR